MQQTLAITSILSVLSSLIFTVAMATESGSKGRPIQVVSDPYSVGNPTHYSVIKGTTKVTFSHPLAGQFGRAEISLREKTGTKLTRFALSPDGKTYRPVLQLETPFRKHNSLADNDAICLDPKAPAPLKLVQIMKDKVDDSEAIAKRRDELSKAKFFDASCFEPAFSEEHRNAIFNAAADVLTTSTQDTSPEPKYLRCLEKYGFAHESGIVQALVKQSITDPKVKPRVRLTCTADKKAKPGQFDDETREISIKKTLKPDRDDYAVKIFHELLHSAPLTDGTPLAAMEECCTMGEQCEVLKAYGLKRANGEKKISLAEAMSPKIAIESSKIAVYEGPDRESLQAGAMTNSVKNFEKLAEPHEPPLQCTIDTSVCDSDKTTAFDRIDSMGQCVPTAGKTSLRREHNIWITLSFPESVAAIKPKCEEDILGLIRQRMKTELCGNDNSTVVELMKSVPQTSPIEWEASKAVPVRMANNGADAADATAEVERPAPPSRTIASVSPLPDEAPQRQLGSARNRADVASTSRASALVDTMENAARKVSQTLTPEKLELLKVDKNQIFESSYKPKTRTPHYLVASSATSAIKVADIGDLKGFDFPNPFATTKQKVDRDTGLFTTIENDGKSKKIAALDAKGTKALGADVAKDNTPGGLAIPANPSQNSSAINATTANSKDRTPTASKTHEFKTMDRTALIKFVTSGYRNLSSELENPELAAALVKNEIQILDHESRRIGSMKPKSTFVYRDDLGRLVQTRAAK